MQKFNKTVMDMIKALWLIWILAVSVITIDQASAQMFNWDEIFDVEFGRR